MNNVDTAALHSGSHRQLLQPVTPPEVIRAKVDAIIVPSARTSPYLRSAIALAEELKCLLVVLCSKHARAGHVQNEVRSLPSNIDFIAIDVSPASAMALPRFETSDMLAGTRFERRTDTSLKRNLALALARLAGWRRVVFLDDDIAVPDATDLRRAVGLLETCDGVGLTIGGYPDNSVVCHAHRDAGGRQDTFLGGGALAVPTDRFGSFFPSIYNEDWFFLLDDVRIRPVTAAGRAWQQPYDPYGNPDRARGEELGDTLAEGIYSLLDVGRRVQDADEQFWSRFLAKRGAFITDVIQRTAAASHLTPGQRWHMTASLRAAHGRLQHITPNLCVAYLRAWRSDRTRWRNFLAEPGLNLEVDVALKALGLDEVCVRRRIRSDASAPL